MRASPGGVPLGGLNSRRSGWSPPREHQSDARDLMVKPGRPRGDSLHRPGGGVGGHPGTDALDERDRVSDKPNEDLGVLAAKQLPVDVVRC
jgi:hypothetical protein